MGERLEILLNGEHREVEIISRTRNSVRFVLGGREYLVEFPASVPDARSSGVPGGAGARKAAGASPRVQSADGSFQILAPIPGVICEITVEAGDKVEAGALLLRLEAMKMQNGIFAPADGVVARIHAFEGKEVGDGELLIELTPA